MSNIEVKLWEAYKPNSQECLNALTKEDAEKYATDVFGGYDLVCSCTAFLTRIDLRTLLDNGYFLD